MASNASVFKPEERPFAGVLDRDVVAFTVQPLPQGIGDLLLVLDDEDPRRHVCRGHPDRNNRPLTAYRTTGRQQLNRSPPREQASTGDTAGPHADRAVFPCAAAALWDNTGMVGRIKSVVRGLGIGYIRDDLGRDVFFHKGDVVDKAYNDLEVGTAVKFDVIEDAVSGARAQRIRPIRRTK